MNLCFLGSSVTEGAASLETSFAEYIAVRNNCTYVKEAVGGTTLADNDKTSYIQRMLHNIDPNAQFDAFICQLSTNDASNAIPLGEISSSRNLEDFDTKTVLGALEYIIVYADTTWHCPVVFYTGTQYDSPAYGKMVEQLLKLQEKYEIGVIDLWNDAEMNQVSEEDYKLYMFDGIHPTQAGYLNWWTPKMEAYLYDYLGQ
jgi:lysophospholipase L1-like esterase